MEVLIDYIVSHGFIAKALVLDDVVTTLAFLNRASNRIKSFDYPADYEAFCILRRAAIEIMRDYTLCTC